MKLAVLVAVMILEAESKAVASAYPYQPYPPYPAYPPYKPYTAGRASAPSYAAAVAATQKKAPPPYQPYPPYPDYPQYNYNTGVRKPVNNPQETASKRPTVTEVIKDEPTVTTPRQQPPKTNIAVETIVNNPKKTDVKPAVPADKSSKAESTESASATTETSSDSTPSSTYESTTASESVRAEDIIDLPIEKIFEHPSGFTAYPRHAGWVWIPDFTRFSNSYTGVVTPEDRPLVVAVSTANKPVGNKDSTKTETVPRNPSQYPPYPPYPVYPPYGSRTAPVNKPLATGNTPSVNTASAEPSPYFPAFAAFPPFPSYPPYRQ